jgi:hypothetical protein
MFLLKWDKDYPYFNINRILKPGRNNEKTRFLDTGADAFCTLAYRKRRCNDKIKGRHGADARYR